MRKSRPARDRALRIVTLSAMMTSLSMWDAPARAVECVPAAQSDFVDALEQWNTAARTGHPDKITRLYAQHATLLPANGTAPRVGFASIRHHFLYLLPDQPVVSVLNREIRIGCEFAIDSGIYLLTSGARGARKTEKHRYTLIYTRYEDSWLIEHHHASLLAPDPTAVAQSQAPAALPPLSVAKLTRTPAVAGYLLRAPGKLKSQSNRTPKSSSAASDDIDYRPGTWINSNPVFKE
jgi:uncharacterized protein (TIGR02246 family)